MDFEEIYRLYFKDIYRYTLSLARDTNISEEIAQETLYKALNSIHQFDGTKDIRAWLFTIAKNTYFTYCKKKKVIVNEGIFTEIQSDVCFVEKIIDEEHTFLIHQYLHTMNEPYKEVFTLRIFGELPFDTIGKLFGKSSGWARVTFHRAKIQIIEYMEAIEDGNN